MGCVHTHWGKPTIEGCDSLSHVQSAMEKNGEDNQKVEEIDRIISQVPTWGPKHDKIRARWASNIPSKNMLKRVWWCKRSKMESWRWTICCLMNCSKGEGDMFVLAAIKYHMLSWGVVRKGRCYYWFTLRLQERRDVDQSWT
jgi:hypothetical protein